MLHPTQNRPPRAQAIKERREYREWKRDCRDSLAHGLMVANKSFQNFAGDLLVNRHMAQSFPAIDPAA